jgi:hypothetical protein
MAPRIRLGAGTSSNWSGYAVAGSNVTDVKGSWTVPSVDPKTCANGYSAAWVGIDGDNSNTVEQCGTEQDSSGQYYAWYEMYPKGFVRVPGTVKPTDTITAEVQYQPSSRTFWLTLTDGGAMLLNTQQKLPQAQRTSAEWIMEAPWSGGVLPLANFGTITFSGCQATINGVTGVLGSWPNYDSITMVGSSGTKATPTLSSSSSFKVTWGPYCQ